MPNPPRNAKVELLAQSALGESMVTMQDIGHFCGVTHRCVQAWRAGGLLPPPDFVLGRVVRWRRQSILRFIKTRSATGAGE